jgi:hypothetical protein
VVADADRARARVALGCRVPIRNARDPGLEAGIQGRRAVLRPRLRRVIDAGRCEPRVHRIDALLSRCHRARKRCRCEHPQRNAPEGSSCDCCHPVLLLRRSIAAGCAALEGERVLIPSRRACEGHVRVLEESQHAWGGRHAEAAARPTRKCHGVKTTLCRDDVSSVTCLETQIRLGDDRAL